MVKEPFSSLIIKISLLLFAVCVENGVELQRTDVELFSSLEELSHLAGTQKEAVNYMRKYLDKENDTYNETNKFIAEFEHLAELAYSNPKEFVSNPINSFLLIKYYYYDLQSFLSKFKFIENPEYIESFIRSKINLPNEEDYKGAVRALLRLQDTYLLSPLEMSKGVFWHSKSFRPLNAFECYEIGRVAQNNSDYKHAINWFREALNKTANSTIDKISCIESIAYSLLNLGEVKEAIKIVKEGLNEEPDNVYLLAALETFQKAIIEAVSSNIDWIIESETVSLKDLFKDVAAANERLYSYDRTVYTALCRGDETKVVRKQLSCRYITYNPLLRIAPVKEEQVFDDPPIWVYHDVLTRNQADKMIDLVRSSLNRARVATPGTDGTVDDVRISKLLV